MKFLKISYFFVFFSLLTSVMPARHSFAAEVSLQDVLSGQRNRIFPPKKEPWTEKEAKTHFNKLALKYHPDKLSAELIRLLNDTQEPFIKLEAAYEEFTRFLKYSRPSPSFNPEFKTGYSNQKAEERFWDSCECQFCHKYFRMNLEDWVELGRKRYHKNCSIRKLSQQEGLEQFFNDLKTGKILGSEYSEALTCLKEVICQADRKVIKPFIIDDSFSEAISKLMPSLISTTGNIRNKALIDFDAIISASSYLNLELEEYVLSLVNELPDEIFGSLDLLKEDPGSRFFGNIVFIELQKTSNSKYAKKLYRALEKMGFFRAFPDFKGAALKSVGRYYTDRKDFKFSYLKDLQIFIDSLQPGNDDLFGYFKNTLFDLVNENTIFLAFKLVEESTLDKEQKEALFIQSLGTIKYLLGLPGAKPGITHQNWKEIYTWIKEREKSLSYVTLSELYTKLSIIPNTGLFSSWNQASAKRKAKKFKYRSS